MLMNVNTAPHQATFVIIIVVYLKYYLYILYFLGHQFPSPIVISKSQFYFFYYSSNIPFHFQLAFSIILYKSNPMWLPLLVYSTNLQRHHFEDAVHYHTTLNRWNPFCQWPLVEINSVPIVYSYYFVTIANHYIYTRFKTKSCSKWRHVTVGSRLCCSMANSYLSPTLCSRRYIP